MKSAEANASQRVMWTHTVYSGTSVEHSQIYFDLFCKTLFTLQTSVSQVQVVLFFPPIAIHLELFHESEHDKSNFFKFMFNFIFKI